MWLNFFLENTHFALNLFTALVIFAIFFLYLDSWILRRSKVEIPKMLGLILISISYVIHGVFLETTVLETSILGKESHELLLLITKFSGYLLLSIGLILDPLPQRPEEIYGKKNKKAVLPFSTPPIVLGIIKFAPFAYPVLTAITAFLFIRRSTIGLENHLKKVALGFFIISISELISLGYLLQETANIDLYNFVAPFGPLWIIQHALTFVGSLILVQWVAVYLLRRFFTQLFMIFTASILAIFLLTTVSFTGLLLNNLQNETLSRLDTDVKVLKFAIDGKKAETLSDAQVLAQNTQVASELKEKANANLAKIAEDFLLSKKGSVLVVVDENGQVVARGEDKERFGQSISDDPLIKRALIGESASSVVTKDGAISPEISIRSSTPIKEGEEIIGAVLTGVSIDNAFVDGIKEATDLEASIYADNILSATTIVSQDNKTRYVGVKEEDENIKENVLNKSEGYVGAIDILNIPYFAAYLPLTDVDNVPVGMLFVGEQQSGVLQTAGRSIELTFIVTAILLVLSVIPSTLIAKYISGQLE